MLFWFCSERAVRNYSRTNNIGGFIDIFVLLL